MTTITREEWVRRYAARIEERIHCGDKQSLEVAEVGASSEEDMCRISGKPVEWLDEPGLTPEDAADDELSYWDDDGED